MSRELSPVRACAELRALQASVDRAGLALACAYSSAAEFEADIIRAQRARGAFDPWYVMPMRFALGATAVVAAVALVTLFT